MNRDELAQKAIIAPDQRLKAKGYTAYVSWGKGKRQPLRFSKSGDATLERAYATHYLLPKTSAAPARTLGPVQ
jgi:hypothetical protein